MFNLIAAIGTRGQLGQGGGLPWPTLPYDLDWFRTLTQAPSLDGAEALAQLYCVSPTAWRLDRWVVPAGIARGPVPRVVVGRRTWESPAFPRRLVGRHLVVLTRAGHLLCDRSRGWEVAPTFAAALAAAPKGALTTVAGGAQVYAQALTHPDAHRLFLARVDYDGPADTWWPAAWRNRRMVASVASGAFGYARTWHQVARGAPVTDQARGLRYHLEVWAPDA